MVWFALVLAGLAIGALYTKVKLLEHELGEHNLRGLAGGCPDHWLHEGSDKPKRRTRK